MTFFRATDLRALRAGEEAHQDEDEDIEVGTFTLAQVQAMIRRGEVKDAKTVAGLAFL